MKLRIVIVATALCASAPAQELFSWNAFEVSTRLSEGWELTLHSRIRTRHEFHQIAQVRGGPQLGYRLQRWSFRGAYYFEPDHSGDHDPSTGYWESGHRVFGSVDATLRPARTVSVIPRFMVERFLTSDRGNYNRYRSGARINIGGRTGPYLQHEWMFVASGLQILRNGAGMRFSPGRHWSLEGGWLFDQRGPSWGGNRQAIVSSLHYAWGE